MKKEKILIIEDEKDVLDLIDYNLSKEGYIVRTAKTGEAGLEITNKELPDLIILDLMLPGIDGLEICRTLKKTSRTDSIPIVMLTAKGEESDIVTGLELGADDYITKPFSTKVLIARVRAILRRGKIKAGDENTKLVVGDLAIDPDRHEVIFKNKKIDLTSTEFKLLHYLARKPGRVFSRYQIVDAVKGADYPVTERSVDVQIVGLRKKLGESGKYISTIRGIGYKFRDDIDD
jgi:two-component system phosphate regulon response regulator PhoB